MHFGVVGDIHGDFDALDRIMNRHPDVAFWLSVGDVASVDFRYPEPAAPLYFVKGNNEDFSFLAAMGSGAPTPHAGGRLHFLENGTRSVIDGVAVAALGGTFAPTWYETPARDLPYPGRPQPESEGTAAKSRVKARGPRSPAAAAGGFSHTKVRDDKRRHFVLEEVEACERMRGIDVLLTHEAARPFIVVAGHRRIDAGKAPINQVLAAMQPRLHFFGHHHRAADAVREGVPSIGLDLVSQSWVLVDSVSFAWQRIET